MTEPALMLLYANVLRLSGPSALEGWTDQVIEPGGGLRGPAAPGDPGVDGVGAGSAAAGPPVRTIAAAASRAATSAVPRGRDERREVIGVHPFTRGTGTT